MDSVSLFPDESLGNLIITLPECASVSNPDLKTEATD